MSGRSDQVALMRLNVPVKPGHFETPQSYLTRFCAANGVDVAYYRNAVRSRRQATGDSTVLGAVIEELGGPAADHWQRSHAAASVGFANACGIRDPFGRQRAWRIACTHCSGGADVTTYDHIRSATCLKHRRWCGPGTTNETQRSLTDLKRVLIAERTARRLIPQGWIDLDLYNTCWEAVRDWTYMTGLWSPALQSAADSHGFVREVDDRAALYPETVRLLSMVSNPEFRHLCEAASGGSTRRRAWMHRELRWLPIERWIVAEAIEECVEDRQSRLRYR